MPRLINYPHVASMVFGVPLFATPALVTAVKSVLEPRLLGKDTGSVESMAPLAILGGDSVAGVLSRLLKGTVLERVLTTEKDSVVEDN
mgnify:CR=1 FL=1